MTDYSFMKSGTMNEEVDLPEGAINLFFKITDKVILYQVGDFYRTVYKHNNFDTKFDILSANKIINLDDVDADGDFEKVYVCDKTFFNQIFKLMIVMFSNNQTKPMITSPPESLIIIHDFNDKDSDIKLQINTKFKEDMISCNCQKCAIAKLDIDAIWNSWKPKTYLEKLLKNNFDSIITEYDSIEM